MGGQSESRGRRNERSQAVARGCLEIAGPGIVLGRGPAHLHWHTYPTHPIPFVGFVFRRLIVVGSKATPPPTSLSLSLTRRRAERESMSSSKVFTLEEVAKHNTKDDCWLIIGGKVLQFPFFTSHRPHDFVYFHWDPLLDSHQVPAIIS